MRFGHIPLNILLGEIGKLAQPRVARNHAERHACGFAMPMLRGSSAAPMAMSRPAVSRPTMPARVVAAATRTTHRDHFGMGVPRFCLGVLPIRIHAVTGCAMAAGEGTEQGQALIVGVGRLNFFTVVDAARSGVRLSGSRDQRGGENGSQNGSQGFIL